MSRATTTLETRKSRNSRRFSSSFFSFVFGGREREDARENGPEDGKTARRDGVRPSFHRSREAATATATPTPTPTVWTLVVLSRISDNATSVISGSEVFCR